MYCLYDVIHSRALGEGRFPQDGLHMMLFADTSKNTLKISTVDPQKYKNNKVYIRLRTTELMYYYIYIFHIEYAAFILLFMISKCFIPPYHGM